jgi:hypothetical protein
VGAQYTYLSYEEGLYYNEEYSLVLTSTMPMSVYLKQGSIYRTAGAGLRNNEPYEFNYDVAIRN